MGCHIRYRRGKDRQSPQRCDVGGEQGYNVMRIYRSAEGLSQFHYIVLPQAALKRINTPHKDRQARVTQTIAERDPPFSIHRCNRLEALHVAMLPRELHSSAFCLA